VCAQGVRYVVPDADKGDVCRNPDTSAVSWRNETDPVTGEAVLTPLGLLSSDGWAFDCHPSPSEDHPFGQFCTPFKNPGAGDFPDDTAGYSHFDNILHAWIIVFQHVSGFSASASPQVPSRECVCCISHVDSCVTWIAEFIMGGHPKQNLPSLPMFLSFLRPHKQLVARLHHLVRCTGCSCR